MSSLDDTRSIERQRFFDGQRLVASDLARIEEFNREMRWLHNASLHQPGIGEGFAVSGRKGDREVVVGPGYAVDDLGREVVLTGSRTIPVPPVAGDVDGNPQRYVLTVQYPADEELEEVELREGVCDTRGAVRLREEPIFCWVPLNPDGSPAQEQDDILTGRTLVLAEVAVRDCKLDKDISSVQRRNARPPTQPHVACGVEAPTRWTDWNPWEDPEIQAGEITVLQALRTIYQIAGGLQAEIDTRSAGFRTVPGYHARIDGPRLFEVVIDELPFPVILDGQLSIVEPTATGFSVRVIVLQFAVNQPPQEPGGGQIDAVRIAAAGGFDVSALMLGSLLAQVPPAPDPGDAPAEPPEPVPTVTGAAGDAEPSPLLGLVADTWSVGWMGVEG